MASQGQQIDTSSGQPPAQKKAFKKSLYRGIELKNLLEYNMPQLVKLFRSRQQRRFSRGVHQRYDRLLKKLRKAKKECPYGEKPKGVKTHLRNCIILPEMVGAVVEVYSGRYWNAVEIKADMIGHYLGEFSLTYKPVRHGKVGVGATRSSKFTSLK
eukprot:CAMPEP_0202960746 /NCGR_PEP_ID=MMETSP1396-20130829/4893_1 /ASSEMBLY_ACC=CAM_ASM_000872 /TAXON_ID= /ORGANISM="Pseudokeronopsis sp., Strain Brazil" /LENGTH=155 /DNA_ID=CAMNT_0049680161 /DNA_START=29 /DNA_END=496 /DNA_ORIENTATION=-